MAVDAAMTDAERAGHVNDGGLTRSEAAKHLFCRLQDAFSSESGFVHRNSLPLWNNKIQYLLDDFLYSPIHWQPPPPLAPLVYLRHGVPVWAGIGKKWSAIPTSRSNRPVNASSQP